jgi:protein-tyrosine phosphatase
VPDILAGRVHVVSAPTEDHENQEFRQVCFPILDSPEYWPHNLRILPSLVRGALLAVATAEPGILIHCSAGRDRTGMITTLLLANAGVPASVIADDYAASVLAMAGTTTHAPTPDRQAAWSPPETAGWLRYTRPLVIDFAAGIATHLDTVGLDESERNQLRQVLVSA